MQDNNIKKLWHTNRKCFIEEFSILQTINSEGNYEHTYFEYNHKTQELERLSTCQVEEVKCSGKKDKNGKLIYEGDIVKIYKFSTGEISNRVVVWNEVRCGCRLYTIEAYKRNLHICPQSMINVTTIEVIGNIYENPELLNNIKE